MNILIIQGPNLNLLGLRSSQLGNNLTLDKVNRGIRHFIRKNDCTVKIYQTHKTDFAISLFQRNRNWADGIIFAPSGWANSEYALKQIITLLPIPVIEIHFIRDYQMGIDPEESIFKDVCNKSIIDSPEQVFIRGIDFLLNQLS